MDELVITLGQLFRKPFEVSVNFKTTPAMNEYGVATSASCNVSTLKRRCVYCGLLADNIKEQYCFSNGNHKVREGMVQVMSGYGNTTGDAIEAVTAQAVTLQAVSA